MLEMMIDHYSGGNQAEFARRLGISAQSLSNWIARESWNPELLFNCCEGVSGDWLLSGEGEMLIASRRINTQGVNIDFIKEVEDLREENKALKLQLKVQSDPTKFSKDSRVYRIWMKFMDITEEMQGLYREEKEG